MKVGLCPYLNFDGPKTREAMEFYKGIFGGELTMTTFGEAGVGDHAGMQMSEEQKGYIMHAELKADGFSFMASSGQPEGTVKFGDNISMSLVGDDQARLTEYFNKLGEGGKVLIPLAKQMWGDTFGMLVDKFGIQWMVNISSGQPQQGGENQ